MNRISELAALKKLYLLIEKKEFNKRFHKEEKLFLKEFLEENYAIIYHDISVNMKDSKPYLIDEKGRKIIIPNTISDDCVIIEQQNDYYWYEHV